MEQHQYQRDGIELFYRRWPNHDPERTLVMFHGLASNSTRWNEFANGMAARDSWRILCPDLRGHGRSTFRGRLTSKEWMDDLLTLLDREGCRKAVVGGHCLGANLALRFALTHPERVRGVVLVEPMLPQALTGVMRWLRPVRWLFPLLALPVRMLNALGIHRRHLPVLDLSELDRETRRAMAASGGHDAMLGRYARPNKDLFYMPVATYLQALYQVLRDVGTIEKLAVPALALLSGGALLADPERSRRLLADIPGIDIEHIDALHWIPTEQPEAMTGAIERFLHRLQP